MDISIIIPCRNEEKYINNTIQRIINQKGAANEFEYEIIIIDGMSDDNTCDIVKELIKSNNNIKIYKNEKKITPSAFNIGLNNSAGKYICILGAHVEISNDYLIKCLKTINSVEAVNVGGPWKAKGIGYIGEAIALAFQNPLAIGGAKGHSLSYNGYVDTVWGGFYKKEIFDEIGKFDEKFIRNQDDELNYRLNKAGYKIWQNSEIKYFYICRNKITSLFRQYYQYGFWKVAVIKKHRLPASLRHLIPGIFILALMSTLVFSFFSHTGIILFIVLILSYLIFITLGSLVSCYKLSSLKYLIVMPFLFIAFHFGYGIGFLSGIIHFFLIEKAYKKKIKDMSLTR